MSNLTHCDGPNCKERKDESEPTRAWSEASWIKVQDNWHDFDFHSTECLVAHFTAERKPEPQGHDEKPTKEIA
jgi:hypothetical protein